ncbi:uncharacterized protein N7482_004517 [Penicillium canariense]|uniref:VWFA domain-containing protein n=1 Tax=Penicillium canariense TaxID=189055 RepID=A0A9W9LQL0_9EURO|nr:uncharacterized protein N7482_004517 [Penicillium canariense]KAJ5168923.1 hypothetical protein N7482_004517 [Penicillium canariense]
MGFAEKLAAAQQNQQTMLSNTGNSGTYGGAPPSGYTGGPPPPAALRPGGYKLTVEKQQQQQPPQYQAYPGPPAQGSFLANEAPARLQGIVQELELPMEVATDLMKLALFDIVLYVDDSGSIEFEERGLRKEQLRQILSIVATVSSSFDRDGIEVRFMNSIEEGHGIKNPNDVNDLVSRVRFSGLTPLGTGLREKVVDKLIVGPARAGRLSKPVLVITITDGQPAGENRSAVRDTIIHAVGEVQRSGYGAGAASFQFSQVGNDLRARDFLADLDEDPEIGHLIDCTSSKSHKAAKTLLNRTLTDRVIVDFELEQDEMARKFPRVNFSREAWVRFPHIAAYIVPGLTKFPQCAKLMLGSIDRSYDSKDERAAARSTGGPAPGGPPPQGSYGGGYGQPPAQQGAPYNAPPAGYPPSSYSQQPGYPPQQQQPQQPPYPGNRGAPGYGQAQPPYGYGGPSPSGPGGYPPPPRRY